MTPRGALYHPFLASPNELEDDEFFPHPFGKGICGQWHFKDDVTEEERVKIRVFGEEQLGDNANEERYEVRTVLAGEGIAIGRQPCEFHRDDF
jgi:cell division control protein 7